MNKIWDLTFGLIFVFNAVLGGALFKDFVEGDVAHAQEECETISFGDVHATSFEYDAGDKSIQSAQVRLSLIPEDNNVRKGFVIPPNGKHYPADGEVWEGRIYFGFHKVETYRVNGIRQISNVKVKVCESVPPTSTPETHTPPPPTSTETAPPATSTPTSTTTATATVTATSTSTNTPTLTLTTTDTPTPTATGTQPTPTNTTTATDTPETTTTYDVPEESVTPTETPNPGGSPTPNGSPSPTMALGTPGLLPQTGAGDSLPMVGFGLVVFGGLAFFFHYLRIRVQ